MINIYCPNINSRVSYAVDLLFKQILRIDYILIDNIDNLNNIVINYSKKEIEHKSIQIIPNNLLFSTEIKSINPTHLEHNEDIIRFFTNKECPYGFDIFSASFYLSSRYEEYNCNEKDEFDRFNSTSSILSKLNVLEYPLIDIWSINLLNRINAFYNSYINHNRQFSQTSTIDIDNAFAFKHKGFFRTTAASVKSLMTFKFSEFKLRINVLLNKEEDPYDTYDYLLNFHKQNNIQAIYFILLGDYRSKDKNIKHTHFAIKQLLDKLKNQSEIGIHPSFFSFKNPKQIKVEVERLNKIAEQTTSLSRNHFLRFSVSETYNHLLNIDITSDYSMGYHDAVGFRAGTCSSFKFFDIKNNKITNLKIIPFAYMDGVLKDRLKLNDKEAIEKIEMLKNRVEKIKGSFISIWHNESVSNAGRWINWRRVYEKSFE